MKRRTKMLKELTEEERQCLSPMVERIELGETAYDEAIRILLGARTNLWDTLRKMYPTARRITHPKDGPWTILLDDNCSGKTKED
jgi:hypothetical protein